VADSGGVEAARDPDVQALAEHLGQADVLDPAELRELIPSLLILEGVAVRESPPFDADGIAELRAANRRLTAACTDAHLLEVVDLVRKALLRYERVYMLSRERLARSVEEHEAIVAALDAGDQELAAERLRLNYTSGLPDLEAQLQDPDSPS
jgi:DNA-binding GntR family transcriptional regulator